MLMWPSHKGLQLSAQCADDHAAQQFLFVVDGTLRGGNEHGSPVDGWIIGIRLMRSGEPAECLLLAVYTRLRGASEAA